MISIKGGGAGVAARRLGGTFALAAVCAVGLVALIAPGTASASYAKCQGSLAPDNGVNINDPNGVDYSFYCSRKVKAFTIYSSSPIDFFSAAPLVYAGTDPSTAEVDGNAGFSCEGKFPGRGFGCNGTFIPGTTPPVQGGAPKANEAIVGQFVPEQKLCATHHKPRPKVWASVTTTQLDASGNPYSASSLPFRLHNGCQAQARHRHKHHHKHH